MACIFCSIVSGEVPCWRVFEDDDCLAFLDAAPATAGHTLVVPKQHAETLLDLDQGQAQTVMASAWQVARLLTTRLDCDGYNLVQSNGAAAWQEVPHMHVHVVPRYQGDDLRQPWLGQALQPEQAAALVKRLR